MHGLCLQHACFAVLEVVLNVLEDVGPPKPFGESSECVVDAGMSFLVVELLEGMQAIFAGFQNFPSLLSILSVEGSVLKVVARGFPLDPPLVHRLFWKGIRLELLAYEGDVAGGFFDCWYDPGKGIGWVFFSFPVFRLELVFLKEGRPSF